MTDPKPAITFAEPTIQKPTRLDIWLAGYCVRIPLPEDVTDEQMADLALAALKSHPDGWEDTGCNSENITITQRTPTKG